jgi:hypothetical protein
VRVAWNKEYIWMMREQKKALAQSEKNVTKLHCGRYLREASPRPSDIIVVTIIISFCIYNNFFLSVVITTTTTKLFVRRKSFYFFSQL